MGVPDMRRWADSAPMPGMRPYFEDILIAYATVPGFVAWRESVGSPFIQTLCKVYDNIIGYFRITCKGFLSFSSFSKFCYLNLFDQSI